MTHTPGHLYKAESAEVDEKDIYTNGRMLYISGVPPPRVTWWKEHALLDDTFQILPDGSVKNVLHLARINRKDLHTVSKCFFGPVSDFRRPSIVPNVNLWPSKAPDLSVGRLNFGAAAVKEPRKALSTIFWRVKYKVRD